MQLRTLLAATADLAWGGACAGCDRPGQIACRECADALRALPSSTVPSGSRQPLTWARGDYAGELRNFVLACKERQGLTLVPLLGDLALGSVTAALREQPPPGPVVLVPVPSSRATVAERGFDLTLLMARRSARGLRRSGVRAHAVRGLRLQRNGPDQAGLDAAARETNRRDSMVAVLAGRHHVLLLDDIVTTGATLTEAARALGAAGNTVLGAAVVAATPRHAPRIGS